MRTKGTGEPPIVRGEFGVYRTLPRKCDSQTAELRPELQPNFVRTRRREGKSSDKRLLALEPMRVDRFLRLETFTRMRSVPGLDEALRGLEALFPVELVGDVLQEPHGDVLEDEERTVDGEAISRLAVGLGTRGAAFPAFQGGLRHLRVEGDFYDLVAHLPGRMTGATVVRVPAPGMLPAAAGLGDAPSYSVPGHLTASCKSSRAVLKSRLANPGQGLHVSHSSTKP